MRRHLFIPVCCVALSACCGIQTVPKDGYEPNDSIAQATLLETSLNATMNEEDPPDYFRLYANEGETAQLELMQTEEHFLDQTLTILDNEQHILGSQTMDTNHFVTTASVTFVAPKTGDYIAEVTGAFAKVPPDSICLQGYSQYTLTRVQ